MGVYDLGGNVGGGRVGGLHRVEETSHLHIRTHCAAHTTVHIKHQYDSEIKHFSVSLPSFFGGLSLALS